MNHFDYLPDLWIIGHLSKRELPYMGYASSKDTLLYLCSPVLGFNCDRGCHDTYFQVLKPVYWSYLNFHFPSIVNNLMVIQHHLLVIYTSIFLDILYFWNHTLEFSPRCPFKNYLPKDDNLLIWVQIDFYFSSSTEMNNPILIGATRTICLCDRSLMGRHHLCVVKYKKANYL